MSFFYSFLIVGDEIPNSRNGKFSSLSCYVAFHDNDDDCNDNDDQILSLSIHTNMRTMSSALAKVRETVSILHLLLFFDNVNGDESCSGVG